MTVTDWPDDDDDKGDPDDDDDKGDPDDDRDKGDPDDDDRDGEECKRMRVVVVFSCGRGVLLLCKEGRDDEHPWELQLYFEGAVKKGVYPQTLSPCRIFTSSGTWPS